MKSNAPFFFFRNLREKKKVKSPRKKNYKICFSAPSVFNVGEAVQHIYSLVYEFRKKRTTEEEMAILARRRKSSKRCRQEFLSDPDPMKVEDPMSDEEVEEEVLDESDASWDWTICTIFT